MRPRARWVPEDQAHKTTQRVDLCGFLFDINAALETPVRIVRPALPLRVKLLGSLPLINVITSRIAGVVAASRYVVCQYNIARDKLVEATGVTPGRRAPTISPLEEEGWVAVSVMVEKSKIANVMDELVKIGAEDILIFNLDNCRV